MSNMQNLYLLVPMAPLVGAIAAGLFGKALGKNWSHRITIALVAVSFAASGAIFRDVLAGHQFNGSVYKCMTSGDTSFEIGFLIDRFDCIDGAGGNLRFADGTHLYHRLHARRCRLSALL